MGSFFTNVQVFAGTAPRGREDEIHGAIVASLRADAKAKGLSAASADEQADRTIFVGPPGRWISVYDEASESQSLDVLDELAGTLSRATGCPTLGILVHDSDVLILRLFEAGELRDAYNSQPAYFGGGGADLKDRLRSLRGARPGRR